MSHASANHLVRLEEEDRGNGEAQLESESESCSSPSYTHHTGAVVAIAYRRTQS
jgi:hypothetical protein